MFAEEQRLPNPCSVRIPQAAMFRQATVAELIIQPHIAPTSGSGNERSWNDEDKDKKITHTDGRDNDGKQKPHSFERRAGCATR